MAELAVNDDDPVSQFVHPREVQLRVLHDSYNDVSQYLKTVQTNILAEFWAMFTQRSKRRPGWRKHTLQTYSVETTSRDGQTVCTRVVTDGSDENLIKELDRHLCVWNGKLCLTTYKATDRILKMRVGSPLSGHGFPDRDDAEDRETLYSYGYIGDMLREFSTCCGFLSGDCPIPPIMAAIANPNRRSAAVYMHGPISDLVPINDRQLSTLNALQYEIEGIQGPPGTGKSTTIFHITNSFSASDQCVLAVCVQNKAVDAIAEKMCQSAVEVPFFVIGHTDRVGETAAQWTLEAQVSRDPAVLVLEGRRTRLAKLGRTLNAFLDAKLTMFTTRREYKRSQQLRSILNELEQSEHEEAILEWERRPDGWRLFWQGYLRRKYCIVNTVAKAVQDAIFELATQIVALRHEVRHALIGTARSVLCTVQTASSSGFHSDEMEPLRERVSTIVIDEAGTVPESKLPLIAALKPKRIVAIGDHKQLSPFTHIAKTEQQGYFHRLESALTPSSIHALTMQYRMHPSICKFVSDEFYDSALQTDSTIQNYRLMSVPEAESCQWFNSPSNTERQPEYSKSFVNDFEAELIPQLFLQHPQWFEGKTVMLMTFYKAQVGIIKSIIETCDISHISDLRVVTVDSAQGSEADVVILSCVRSMRKIGFLQNAPRMCVAISRARERLLILGNVDTVCLDPKWHRLFKHSTALKI